MGQLITDAYRTENSYQHKLENGFGVNGQIHLNEVLRIAQIERCETAIDYGCGAASLSRHAKRVCPVKFQNYDPAIEAFSALPEPADLLVCTDVLEHVEPICLISVLDHMEGLCKKVGYLNIATRPAKRVLTDGRNAHLIQKNAMWWLDTLKDFFDVVDMHVVPEKMVTFVVKPLGSVYND